LALPGITVSDVFLRPGLGHRDGSIASAPAALPAVGQLAMRSIGFAPLIEQRQYLVPPPHRAARARRPAGGLIDQLATAHFN